MRRTRIRLLLAVPLALAVVAGSAVATSATAGLWRRTGDRSPMSGLEVQSLDGRGNNRAHGEWGLAGTPYTRAARPRFADGRSAPVNGPTARYVSNRIFNDTNQNLFSENGVTQWGFTWGQFLDHTFGLRDEAGEPANMAFDAQDPLESFVNTLGHMPFARSAPAPGTGVTTPRQQINTVSSYIDAWVVYGGSADRLEWLREGPVDGRMGNNGAKLLLAADGLLPRRDSRGDVGTAPAMAIDGRLRGQPQIARVAGDVRANENIALLATHTLFAREHNRIVSLLPPSLTPEQKFQIARRIVIAEQQYITYTEFLPALGVRLSQYRGYNPRVNPTLTNEFATVGYRAHSMIHGEIELETDADRYSAEQLEAFEREGIEFELSEDGTEIELAVPLNVAFFNPELVGQLQVGPLLQGIGLESQYKNDEQIDNQLRSVLFQIPVPGNTHCLDGPGLPECFRGVVDLGAIDVERGRDHGMPSYNQLRRAYGLDAKRSFRAITGESTEAFGTDPELTAGDEINDPDSLDFVALFDADGNLVDPDGEEAGALPVRGVRRTTLAARLKAIYGTVNNVDAFTGMVSERHVPGTEFGELQLAIWKKQFEALRDGDRFFYRNDPGLSLIRRYLGIDYRRDLGDLIALNTDIPRDELAENVFRIQPEAEATGAGSGDTGGTTAEAPPEPPSSNPDAIPAVTNGGTAQSSGRRGRRRSHKGDRIHRRRLNPRGGDASPIVR